MKYSFYEQMIDLRTSLKIGIETDTSYASHFHKGCELAYVLSGFINVNINNKTFTATEDDIIFVNPYENHAFINVDKHEKIILILPPFFLSSLETVFRTKKIPCQLNDKNFNKTIKAKLNELLDFPNRPLLVEEGYTKIILGLILSHYKLDNKVQNNTTSFIIDTLSYIEANYQENLSLKSLANKFGYSETYFSKNFKKLIGVTLTDFITTTRIRNFIKIARMDKKLNYSNIALNCGFQSLPSFYRAFKCAYKMSPKEYLSNTPTYEEHSIRL